MAVSARASKHHILRQPRPSAEGTFCNYSHRTCMQSRLEHYNYCLKHILEDREAPYKQCAYISNKTTKRCPNAAPKLDKRDGYCMEHARRLAALRHRAMRKQRPKETPESLLEELDQHQPRTNEFGQEVRRPRSAESVASKALEYASSSDSEPESKLVDHAWRGERDSDVESIDSEQDDPLKHAGIYTAEEVALITRDKLIRLQSLYIDQFKRLQHVLKEKRRKYLHNSATERETYGSIHDGRDDPEQKDKYDELMSMKRYHKRHGTEALLHRQSKERRVAVSEGNNYKPPNYPKCTHLEGSTKCGARTVPLSKFCFQHVLMDGKQILFQACGFGDSCEKPIALLSDHGAACNLHIPIYEIERRLQNKKSPETVNEKDEMEDVNVDVVGGTSSGQEDIKPSLLLLPPVEEPMEVEAESKPTQPDVPDEVKQEETEIKEEDLPQG